jgi:hypothetical protein
MLDVLEQTVGPKFTAIDLMCGLGAISRRIIERFPLATVITVDLDPVLLTLGRESIDGGGRIPWFEGNLKAEDWPSNLPVSQVDAGLSTTAVHWLLAGEVAELYGTLARLIGLVCVLLNGDQMKFTNQDPTVQRLCLGYRDDFRTDAQSSVAKDWDEWWLALRQEADLAETFADRDRRFAWRTGERERAIGSRAPEISPRVNNHTNYPIHAAALPGAGFTEVMTVWQHFDDRVLFALR